MNARSVRRALIAAILAQVIVLVVLPALAGPRIPSGTIVHLRATAGRTPDIGANMAQQELHLDYGFTSLHVPRGVRAIDPVFVELRGSASSDTSLKLGKVVRDPEQLADDALWIQLPLTSASTIDNGPVSVYYEENEQRANKLRSLLARGGALDVTIELDNDGDPTIARVEPAR